MTHDPWCPLRQLTAEVGGDVVSQGRALRLSRISGCEDHALGLCTMWQRHRKDKGPYSLGDSPRRQHPVHSCRAANLPMTSCPTP